MDNRRLELLVWVAIYAGLGGVVLGIVFWRGAQPVLGGAMVALGAALTVVGCVLLWLRARRDRP